MGVLIDEEYEADPRRAILHQALMGGLNPQGAPLTPLAGALQGAQSILAALLGARMESQHRERKAAYSGDIGKIIAGLPAGAGAEELARAYAGSQNPDVVADSAGLLAKAIAGRQAAKFGQPFEDAEGRMWQTSSAGGARELEGIKAPRRLKLTQLGNRAAFADERSGTIQEAPGGEYGVSPSMVYSADRRAAEGAANRGARIQAAQISQGGMLGLAKSLEGSPNMEYMKHASGKFGDKEADNYFKVVKPAAEAGAQALGEIGKARDAISKGAFQGASAPAKFAVAKFVKGWFGDNKNPDRVSATEALSQALDLAGLSQIKPLLGASALTDADRMAVMKTFGQIDSDPAALEKVFQRTEALAKRSIIHNNSMIEKLEKFNIPAEQHMIEPAPYEPMDMAPTPEPGPANIKMMPSAVAPPEALKRLRENPQLAPDFKAKYGYLPPGM